MIKELYKYAGIRYWSSSLLPAFAGTTLLFWLQPIGYSFKPSVCCEFLFATLFFHAGFSFIHHGMDTRTIPHWPRSTLFIIGTACVIIACLLGFHLNRFVSGLTFFLFGGAVIFIGILYVIPPLCLFRRSGGEIVLAYGLGMMPVLGAYLVQTNDLTRKVYMVSLPLVVATGIWVLLEKFAQRAADAQAGYSTLIDLFGLKTSARFIIPVLMAVLYASVLISILSGACAPLASVTLLSVFLALKIIRVSWNDYHDEQKMRTAIKYARLLHLFIGTSICLASFVAIFM